MKKLSDADLKPARNVPLSEGGLEIRLSLLPPPGLNQLRWVTGRKALVVEAVKDGLLTSEEACERYCLSHEEFLSWQTNYQRGGRLGLRVTKLHASRVAA